jgi:TRAP-type C4-dicarboxylate transport system permease large subunit
VNKHVWWFMLAKTLVLALVIFIPEMATWIPRHYLGK